MEETIQIIGEKDGPTSVILAGIHGDERGGINAFKKILPTIQIESGRVFLIYGNPRAIEANKRFTEANLNRMFKTDSLLSEKEKKSYEYERAQFIKKYLDQADAVLDIHSSFVPDSKPFIICEANAQSIVKYLHTNIIVSGFDKIQPGGIDYYMNKRGGVGICVECGYISDIESEKIAIESILCFLNAMGHTRGEVNSVTKSCFNIYKMHTTKTDKFTLAKPFIDFDEIQKDQLIGIDGEEELRAQKQSIVLFAKDCEKSDEEAFLLGEQKDSLAY